MAMGKMPGAPPAGPTGSRRTRGCRSVSPAWTVPWSTGSRKPTARPPATPCVETACLGESGTRPLKKCLGGLGTEAWLRPGGPPGFIGSVK